MGNNSAPAHPAIPPIATTAAPLLNLTERDVNDTNKLTETLANMRNSLLVGLLYTTGQYHLFLTCQGF